MPLTESRAPSQKAAVMGWKHSGGVVRTVRGVKSGLCSTQAGAGMSMAPACPVSSGSRWGHGCAAVGIFCRSPAFGIWSTQVWCTKKRPLLQQSRIRLCFEELSGLALLPRHSEAPANILWASFHTASRNTQNIYPKCHASSVWPLGICWHVFTS